MSRRRTTSIIVVATFVATNVVLVLVTARAVPRYSARYGQSCGLCHVNPTGGGMRSLYATQYIVPEEMSWSVPEQSILDAIDPEIAPNITIGADFRMLYFYSEDKSQRTNFFQMQGDLYVNFQMGERYGLYFDKGITTSYELYGMANVLPASGYLKAGRFMPAYGWRFDDHTAYVREELGFFPPGNTDVGLEAGVYPGRFAINAAVLNGNRGSTSDANTDLAAAARAVYRFSAGSVGLAVGTSGYWNPGPQRDEGHGGVFGYANWRRLTWVGETDWRRTDPTDDSPTTALIATHELSYLIRKGLEVKGTYDFYDPDIDFKTGAKSRYGGGAFVMPSPFLGLEALVRFTRFDDGIDLAGDDYLDTIVQVHFFY